MRHTIVSGVRYAMDTHAITPSRVADTATYQSVRDESGARPLLASWTPTADSALLSGVQSQPLGIGELIKLWLCDYTSTDYRGQAAESASPEDTQ